MLRDVYTIKPVFRQIEQLRRCEIIKEQEVKALCAKARLKPIVDFIYSDLHTIDFKLQRNFHRRK